MKQSIVNIALLILFFTTNSLNGMKTNFCSMVISGMSGRGCETYETYGIIHPNANPIIKIDSLSISRKTFGKNETCIEDLQYKLCTSPDIPFKNKKILLFCASGGTKITLDLLQKLSFDDQKSIIGCLFFESFFSSENEAVMHFYKSNPYLSWLTDIQRCNALLLRLATYIFPNYNPKRDKSSLSKTTKISSNFPTIFMHYMQDPLLPVEPVIKLYGELHNQNPNVYLIIVPRHNKYSNMHLNTLDSLDHEQRIKILIALQAIYKKHNLPYTNIINGTKQNLDLTDLSEFQPDHDKVNQLLNVPNKIHFKAWHAFWLGLIKRAVMHYLFKNNYYSAENILKVFEFITKKITRTL